MSVFSESQIIFLLPVYFFWITQNTSLVFYVVIYSLLFSHLILPLCLFLCFTFLVYEKTKQKNHKAYHFHQG